MNINQKIADRRAELQKNAAMNPAEIFPRLYSAVVYINGYLGVFSWVSTFFKRKVPRLVLVIFLVLFGVGKLFEVAQNCIDKSNALDACNYYQHISAFYYFSVIFLAPVIIYYSKYFLRKGDSYNVSDRPVGAWSAKFFGGVVDLRVWIIVLLWLGVSHWPIRNNYFWFGEIYFIKFSFYGLAIGLLYMPLAKYLYNRGSKYWGGLAVAVGFGFCFYALWRYFEVISFAEGVWRLGKLPSVYERNIYWHFLRFEPALSILLLFFAIPQLGRLNLFDLPFGRLRYDLFFQGSKGVIVIPWFSAIVYSIFLLTLGRVLSHFLWLLGI